MGRSGGFRYSFPGSGSAPRRGPGTAPAGRNGAAMPGCCGRGVGAGFETQLEIGQTRDVEPQRDRAGKLAQQVAVTGVAVLAVFPFEVRDGARCPCFQHRIRRRQGGERQGLEEGDGPNAEPAKAQRLSSRNQLHGYAARVFRVPPKGIPDQCVKLRAVLERVKLAASALAAEPIPVYDAAGRRATAGKRASREHPP